MIKLLLILHDLTTDWNVRVQKVLPLLKFHPSEILLQYAYHIPEDSNDVIASHDRIKRQAGDYVKQQAAEIEKNTSISTKSLVVLGSIRSTLKRVLADPDIQYVILDRKENATIEMALKKNFPAISFIFTTSRQFQGIPYMEHGNIEKNELDQLLNMANLAERKNGHVDVKILRSKRWQLNEQTDTLIFL